MDLISFIKDIGHRITRKKGNDLISRGEITSSLFLIETGLVKAVYVTDDGRELIKSFIKEKEFIGSLGSFLLKEPSRFSVECIEDTSAIQVDYQLLTEFAGSNLDISRQLILFLSQLVIKKEKREYEFLCMDAQERFDSLRLKDPDLLGRVRQQDLARYLGITPVALSRIRGKSLS